MKKITEERVLEIFDGDSKRWEGDNAFQGLQILSKYTDNLIQGASKDIIYSEDISILIQKGISEEDLIKLRDLNWIIEDNCYLACFV